MPGALARRVLLTYMGFRGLEVKFDGAIDSNSLFESLLSILRHGFTLGGGLRTGFRDFGSCGNRGNLGGLMG